MAKPSVGRVVHYVSRGSADGKFPPACRAAVVTEVSETVYGPDSAEVGLCVMNPTGLFFDREIMQNETEHVGGTWHWPERTDSRTLGETLADPEDLRASWPKEVGTNG